MKEQLHCFNVSGFRDYLVNHGYSKHVIPSYVRKVKELAKHSDGCPAPSEGYETLREAISDYLTNMPLSLQKETCQAALHLYFYFVNGERWKTRFLTTDFETNPSIENEVHRFQLYLSDVAKLSKSTIISQCNTVRGFLYSIFQQSEFSPREISAEHIRLYVTQTLRHVSSASQKSMIVRIRSYARFLAFTDGIRTEDILSLPLTSPVWKRATIASHLSDMEVERLFSVYDQSQSVGIRNYAIARCLRDLGLRCSEVASLSIDDFNWRLGTVTIRKTKSNAPRTLPLHALTGKAIEAYLLKSRPVTPERVLFVRFKKQQGFAMGASQVRQTVRYAAIQAGLANFSGTHMLRHTAAKEMINQGVDLKTLADILGHESIETTCMYTKLNFEQLQDVSGTWPGVMG